MASKSVENLFKLKDTSVISTVQKTFTQQLKNTPAVKSIFFPKEPAPSRQAVNPNWVNTISIALVSSSISYSSFYGFNKTINQGNAIAYWKSRLTQSDASAVQASQDLYDWAFPAYCQADGLTFEEYLRDNPENWGQQLAASITQPSFINTTVAKIIASDPNWLKTLNLAFYKVHRLKPSMLPDVVKKWSTAFPNKGIKENWQSYNFVPSNLFRPDEFISSVNSAIQNDQKIQEGPLYNPSSGKPPVMGQVGIWYGSKVDTFVKTDAKALGLYTGKNPDNYQAVGADGQKGCFVAGTSLHLASGTTICIQDVIEGQEVLAQDGQTSIHSNEKVALELRQDTLIYGINDEAPFFLGNHLFWTPYGWKAIDPKAALEENPDRCVGELKIGDRVLRIAQISPFEYEEVKIEKIPSQPLAAGNWVYGQHFSSGPHSYHANGYLVGMNYPQITGARIKKSLAKLSAPERKHIAKVMEPLLPMLSYAIGGGIEQPFQPLINMN